MSLLDLLENSKPLPKDKRNKYIIEVGWDENDADYVTVSENFDSPSDLLLIALVLMNYNRIRDNDDDVSKFCRYVLGIEELAHYDGWGDISHDPYLVRLDYVDNDGMVISKNSLSFKNVCDYLGINQSDHKNDKAIVLFLEINLFKLLGFSSPNDVNYDEFEEYYNTSNLK